MDGSRTAYFAGLFDGEGTVGIYAVSGKNDKCYWAPKLAVTGTFRPMIEAMHNHFSVGQLSTQKRQDRVVFPNGANANHTDFRQGWRWSVTRRSEISFVLRAIRPWLLEKATQADIVLGFIDGDIEGEVASRRCSDAKRFSFSADAGEPVRRSTGSLSEQNPMAKLTFRQAEEVRALFSSGVSRAALMEDHGLSKHQLSRLLQRQTYAVAPTTSGTSRRAER